MGKKITIPYDILYDLYIAQNMSQSAVANALGCSVDTIVRNLKEYQIGSHKPCDWLQHEPIQLSEYQQNILHGAMLGDGCLYKSQRALNAQFTYTSKSKQHVEFVCQTFSDVSYHGGVEATACYDKRTNKTYHRYTFRSINNVAFETMRNKWYRNGKKIIPDDLIVNPTICLIWYIGDGCICNNKKTQHIKLATQCFSKKDQENILMPQLKDFEASLIKADISKDGEQQYFIYIPKRKIKKFLEYIGPCPFSDYEYKWDYKEYKNFSLQNRPEVIPEIIAMFNDGFSAGTIAKNVGIDRSTVVKYLIKNGLDTKKNLFQRKKVGDVNEE